MLCYIYIASILHLYMIQVNNNVLISKKGQEIHALIVFAYTVGSNYYYNNVTHSEVNYVIIIRVMIVIDCANLKSSLKVCISFSCTLVIHCHHILHCSEILSPHIALFWNIVIVFCIVLKYCHHILYCSETLSPHIALFFNMVITLCFETLSSHFALY